MPNQLIRTGGCSDPTTVCACTGNGCFISAALVGNRAANEDETAKGNGTFHFSHFQSRQTSTAAFSCESNAVTEKDGRETRSQLFLLLAPSFYCAMAPICTDYAKRVRNAQSARTARGRQLTSAHTFPITQRALASRHERTRRLAGTQESDSAAPDRSAILSGIGRQAGD